MKWIRLRISATAVIAAAFGAAISNTTMLLNGDSAEFVGGLIGSVVILCCVSWALCQVWRQKKETK
jgi:hypothetical protein